MLKWSNANAKTQALAAVPSLAPFLSGKRKIYSLDLLSGHFCPFADKCLSKAVVDGNGRRTIQDGPNTEFRCFSASQEVLFTNVYKSRQHNSELLRAAKSTEAMEVLIEESMPSNLGICRIHVAGDMFSPAYFGAWIEVAKNNPSRLFYAYTKSLPYWVARKAEVAKIPNLVLTASYGGRRDDLIKSERLRFARVVYSQAAAGKLPIDHDDSHAADPSQKRKSFGLLIHGVQPKGTEAAEALKSLKGEGSYNRKAKV